MQTWQWNCRTCGRRLQVGNDRPCPQPEVVQAYLNEHTDFTGGIAKSDRVCFTCYKSHLALLKQNNPTSRDEDLRPLVESVRTHVGMGSDIISMATNKMLVDVGTMLLDNQATLLPIICANFHQYATELAVEQGIEESQEVKSVNSRWILGEITTTYQHHVAYVCKVRKYGTLVYRPTSDIHALLSEALWKIKNMKLCKDKTNVKHVVPVPENESMGESCSIGHMNSLIHTQIESYIGKGDSILQDYDELNMNEQIEKIEPQLWNAIRCITRCKSEIRGTSKVDDPSSQAHHIKKVRCFFLLCVIMFVTNDRCSMPMHTLMTDLVESQGGSSVLIRTLNRLGVCSSADTLARFIQHKRTVSEYHCFKHLTKDAFTVVSADNLDFLHSFSRVFCGNQKASWHGTTIQVVQPLPSLSLPEYYATPQNRHTCTGHTELSLSQTSNHTELSLPQTSGHTELSLPQFNGHTELSLPRTSGHTELSLPKTSGHTELSLPQTSGHTELSLPQTSGHTELSLTQFNGHTELSLPQTSGHTELSLPRTSGHTELSLPQTSGHTELSLPQFNGHTELSLPQTSGHTELSLPQTSGHTELSLPQFNGHTELSLPQASGHTELSLTQFNGHTELSLPQFNGHTELSLPRTSGHTELSLPQTSGHTELSLPQFNGHTELSLPQTSGHTELSLPQTSGHTELSLTQFNGHTELSLPRTSGHTELSLPQTSGHTELSLPQTSGHTELSLTQFNGHTELSLPRTSGHTELSLPQFNGHTELSLPRTSGHTELSLPQTSGHTELSLPQFNGHTELSLPQTSGHTELSLTQFNGHTELSLPQTSSHTELSLTQFNGHTELSLPRTSGHTELSLTQFNGHTELSLPRTSGHTELSLPQTSGHRDTSRFSLKRLERSSPIPSPSKSTRSPLPKIQRRLRTGTESTCRIQLVKPAIHLPPPTNRHNRRSKHLTLLDFVTNTEETQSQKELQSEMNVYIAHRVALHDSGFKYPFISLQDYYVLTRPTHTERSHVMYLEVLDAVADSKDTMMGLLFTLKKNFIEDRNMQWLVLEGDAKLFEILKSLTYEYGEELDWLIPYPGDFHLLMNFQKAIMKPYYDAGLKAMAQSAGYPLQAIQTCSQFQRTHHFLLEAWEAIYREMIHKYEEENPNMSYVNSQDILAIPKDDFTLTFNHYLSSISEQCRKYFEGFKIYIQKMARTDDTWRFWVQFVFEDVMAYISLHLAIRSGNWDLRVASVKSMAAVFTAFDHITYQKLITQHLEDIATMPAPILTMFRQGAFVVSITGRPWHSVGIDEGHEMLINKDCKTSIIHPLPDYINRIAQHLPYRSKAIKNLQSQLFPTTPEKKNSITTPYTTNSNDFKTEQNVNAMVSLLQEAEIFTMVEKNRGLVNKFTKKEANAVQQHDLMNFRLIGQQEYKQRISAVILKNPSVGAPNRKRRLQTFSEKKVTKSRVTQLEKDRRLVITAMKKKMKFSQRTGKPIDRPGEQLIELPLALCDNTGNPIKGQKSYTTRFLQCRYKETEAPAFLVTLPWRPKCCIIEGMFIINTTPLGSHRVMADYAKFLFTRFIITQFKKGCEEVHIIFDNPGRLANTPKYFEHRRRDKSAIIQTNHHCDIIVSTTKIPSKWRENLLHCRECKRSLIKYLTHFFLHYMHKCLQQNQTVYVAGGYDNLIQDTCWYVRNNTKPQPDPRYTSNAEETDTRIWLHVRQTELTKVLVISPDTDIYHIGLPLVPHSVNKEVLVQINPINSKDMKLVDLPALNEALSHDPDLAGLELAKIPQIVQTLFVCTGCDYISFFSGVGKATFLRYFFQHATFITGATAEGSLADIQLNTGNFKRGFLAFLRLVGTAYYKKHNSAFQFPSPNTHFLQFSGSTPLVHHKQWIDDVRQNIADRSTFENNMIPTTDALLLHWKRTCWILHMWAQSQNNTMDLEPITEYGWNLQNDQLQVTWDTEENMMKVRERVSILLKGCKCSTGCKNRVCGCRKKSIKCGEGCQCTNCENTDCEHTASSHDREDLTDVTIEEAVVSNLTMDTEDEEEFAEFVFAAALDDDNFV